jgi:putative transposase
MLDLMEQFRLMTNECVDAGLKNDASSLGKLSKLCYHSLKRFGTPSYYRLTAMSRAAGILSAGKKSQKRGNRTKNPHAQKPLLVSCYGFAVVDGVLRIPAGDKQFEEIPLSRHVLDVLSETGLKVRSFTLNANTLSIVFSKETSTIECTGTQGLDRNVGNVSSGNEQSVDVCRLDRLAGIQLNTRDVVASFRRNDVRIRQQIASKYGRRKRNRTRQFIHAATNSIIARSIERKEAIAIEDITGIKWKLFRKGDGKGKRTRGRVNGVAWAGEIERQIKRRWAQAQGTGDAGRDSNSVQEAERAAVRIAVRASTGMSMLP